MRPFLVVNIMLLCGSILEFFLLGNSIEQLWERIDSIRWPNDWEWD